VQVSKNGSFWELNQKVPGCEGIQFEVGVYQLIDSTELRHHTGLEVKLELISPQVRSSADPLLVVVKDTQGTMMLGISSEQLVTTGIIILVISLVILVQPVVYVIRKCDCAYRPELRNADFQNNQL